MKTLLGTHMGHSALYTMCQIVQNPLLLADAHLIRGAVFFIHTSLWGNTPLPNLHCPPNSVLPSFLHVRIYSTEYLLFILKYCEDTAFDRNMNYEY